MFARDQYELIDFGEGRKLERFGGVLVDRPCPAAEGLARSDSTGWADADARYGRAAGSEGAWHTERPIPEPWSVGHDSQRLLLKPTPFGHVGVFPEQSPHWDWIADRVRRAGRAGSAVKVLNLFAYTGGSTLAAAAAGAEVVHVDAAKNVVAWARHNAELSGLADAPIRWIVEDAATFVRREVKRKNQYDAVILDPPSYGHGPKGEAWKIETDLMTLLEGCRELTKQSRAFMLLTCHSPTFGPAELEAALAEAVFGHCGAGAAADEMTLDTADGRKLPSGVVARWPA